FPLSDIPRPPKSTLFPYTTLFRSLIETKHKVTIAGQEISYTARAGIIQLKDAEDKTTASIFHIAYTRDEENGGSGFILGVLELKDRKSTRLNSSHVEISYAVFCLK